MPDNTTKVLKIIQINVNSIYSKQKRHEFKLFLNEHDPDVVLICETKLNNKAQLHFKNYKIYRNDRNTNNGGGTAILIKEKIDSEYIKTPTNVKSIECCIAVIKAENNKKIFISSIYKPPKNKFITNDLNEILKLNDKESHIIAGDFNAHHTLWNDKKICPEGKSIANWYNINGTAKNIKIYASKEPTCHRTNSGSFIDFGFTIGEIKITNDYNIKELPSAIFSDHSAIIFKIECTPNTKQTEIIKNYSQANWKDMEKYVNEKIITVKIPTNNNINETQIEKYASEINKIYKEAIDKFIPNIKISDGLIVLSSQSQKLLKEKKTLQRKKFRNKFTNNYNNICNDLKNLQIMIINSIKTDYSKHYENKIKNIKVDNNTFKNIKSITRYKHRDTMPSTIFDEQKNSFTNDNEKAEALAIQFEKTYNLTHKNTSIMENIVNSVYESYNNEATIQFSEEIPANFKDNPDFNEKKENNNTINNYHEYFMSTNELQTIIKTRNSKKSNGYDKTSNFMLKKMPHNFIQTLVILFNHIINIQYIPEMWKFGIVTPLPKPKRDSSIVTNYRPITQLSAIVKCLEKKLDQRLRALGDANNILSDNQFGFRPNRSTEMAVSIFLTDVTKNINEKKATIAVLIDYQAAFDTIWHKGLIYKLHTMKFDRNIICMIKNYLSNRKFAVKINNEISSKKPIVAGAPQGGVLSATLFIFYMADFPVSNDNIKNIFFADDAIAYKGTNKVKKTENEMNNYLTKISAYTNKWKMKLNEKKCEAISIVGQCNDLPASLRKNAINIQIKINNKIIENCKIVKYLGVTISRNFKFINHIESIIQKANIAKAELNKFFKNKLIGENVKILAYKQLIRPIFLYASSCWFSISSNQMEKIRKFERWFLRASANIYRNETNKKYINSQILYEKTKTNRIDRKITEHNIKFIDKVKQHSSHSVREISNFDSNYINNNKYKPLNYLHTLNENNTLYTNEKLLYYNRKQKQPNQTIYVTNQNMSNAQNT